MTINIRNLVDGFHKIEKDGIWYDVYKEGQDIYYLGAEDRNYNTMVYSLADVCKIFGTNLKDGKNL